MRIVICGAGGRLGRVVRVELAAVGHNVTALGHADLDVTSAEHVQSVLAPLQPEIIINCSAYNDVDRAERDQGTAFAVNARGPSLLAAAAEKLNAVLIHYGTDFVFNGTALHPYSEEDLPDPLSVYGASKMLGEAAVRRTHAHYILRVASLFGGTSARGRQSTVDWIATRLMAGLVVHAAVDRVVSPSYAFDVARATRALVEGQPHFGTYHCVNSGYTTWYELALEVGRALGMVGHIEPLRAADLLTNAWRPLFCALSNRKLASIGIEMPSWQAAIHQHLAVRCAAETPARAGAA